MNINIGIVGLAKSGKTAVFNALTKGKGAAEGQSLHIGTARVAEPRLTVLANIFHPKRVVPVEMKYVDVGASIKGLAKEKGVSGQLLVQLSQTDALLNMARAFADETIPPAEGGVNVERDIASMNMELTFSDLAIIERRLERLEDSLKGAKVAERPVFLREQALLMRIKTELEKDVPIREQKLTPEESKAILNYQFLTAKPLLIVVNIGEEQIPQASSLEAELKTRYAGSKCNVIALCGKLEMELAQLDDEAAAAFRAEYGMKESALDRTTKLSYELLGLVSFFTIVSDEVKAWSIPQGTTALKAAGKIHSDMERGFIRAEVISYDDLVKCSSLAEARKRGLLRLESKDYLVNDGDVITFLFNV